jgi:hypothetical protein
LLLTCYWQILSEARNTSTSEKNNRQESAPIIKEANISTEAKSKQAVSINTHAFCTPLYSTPYTTIIKTISDSQYLKIDNFKQLSNSGNGCK